LPAVFVVARARGGVDFDGTYTGVSCRYTDLSECFDSIPGVGRFRQGWLALCVAEQAALSLSAVTRQKAESPVGNTLEIRIFALDAHPHRIAVFDLRA